MWVELQWDGCIINLDHVFEIEMGGSNIIVHFMNDYEADIATYEDTDELVSAFNALKQALQEGRDLFQMPKPRYKDDILLYSD